MTAVQAMTAKQAITRDGALGEAMAAFQKGDFVAAEQHYLAAIRAFPDDPEPRYHRGLFHLAIGRPKSAALILRQVLALHPTPRTYLALGLALEMAGELKAALGAFRSVPAGSPERAEAAHGYARTAQRLGLLAKAVAAYRETFSLKPGDAASWCDFGTALMQLCQWSEAASAYHRALSLDPGLETAWINLAFCLDRAREPAAALVVCAEAERRGIDHPALHANRAAALRRLGRVEAAGEAIAAALLRHPGDAKLLAAQSACFVDGGDWEAARRAAEAALAADPASVDALGNLGAALISLGRLDEAEAALRRAVALAPWEADPAYNLALALLKKGNYREGFARYEARFAQSFAPATLANLPPWQGERLEGGLLVFAEQGLGDVLQFVRFLPRLEGRAGEIWFAVPRSLERLLRGSLPGWVRFLSEGDALPPGIAAAVPLLSLPYRLGIDHADLPGPIPYLRADPALVARWGERLGPRREGELRGGLVWAGDARPHLPHYQAIDRRRSMKLADFAPLGEIPGIEWFSLQMGPPRAELAHPPAGLVIRDAMEGVGDFADTAALLAHLDFLVSVDTAPAHLAGALGKPVFLLSRFDGCWRWLNNRPESPWYPTLRLYGQPRPGDWATPLAALAADLAGLEAKARAAA
jgi:Flp pilus assembly protein TadD